MQNLCSDGSHLLLSYQLPGACGCWDLHGGAGAWERTSEQFHKKMPGHSCWQASGPAGLSALSSSTDLGYWLPVLWLWQWRKRVYIPLIFLQKPLLLLQLVRVGLKIKQKIIISNGFVIETCALWTNCKLVILWCSTALSSSETVIYKALPFYLG